MGGVLALSLILKYLHVLMAIVAVGFNASYPIWFSRARWVAVSLVLYVVLVLVAVIGYTPTLKGQIAALETGGVDSAVYPRLNRRGNIVGAILLLDVLVIIFLMVTKPNP